MINVKKNETVSAAQAVEKAVKKAKEADKFTEELLNDLANKKKFEQLGIVNNGKKSAYNSANVFITEGKNQLEKKLDMAELKKEMLIKYADEFVRKHPELKDPEKLEEFLGKIQ